MSVPALSIYKKSSEEQNIEKNTGTNTEADAYQSTIDSIEFGKHFEKGQEFKRCDNIKEAIYSYQAALKINPSSGWAHHCIAQAYVELGSFKKAINHYKQALAFLPEIKNTQTLLQLGRTYVYADKLEDAWLCINTIREKNREEYEKLICTEVLIPLASRIKWIIDADWYCYKNSFEPQLDERIDRSTSVALDYFSGGSYGGKKSLHWVIDDIYILSQLAKSVCHNDKVPPVLLFIDSLTNGNSISPHWIIQKANKSNTKDKSVLKKMWALADRDFNNPDHFNILFDPEYYQSQLDEIIDNPVKHYITVGAQLSLDPHPAFHASYYKRKANLDESSDAVRHYLVQRGYEKYSPNPAFEYEYYRRKYSSTEFLTKSPVEHFLQVDDKKNSIRCFDALNYNTLYKDIRENNIEPEFHFLVHGIREAHRVPFKGFSRSYVKYKARNCRNYYQTESATYYGEKWHKHENIIVVSHSACRTGAPLIALRLVKELAKVATIEVSVILLKDGPLSKEFSKFSHVITLKNEWGADQEENKAVIDSFIGRKPGLCFCNSAESRSFGRSLHAVGIPVVSLVHEVADHYQTPKIWGEIFDVSDKVVFPSKFVQKKSDQMLVGYRDKKHYESVVLPQGLLKDNFARYNAVDARTSVRKSLKISNNEILILACGTLDLRKGIDIFLRCAVTALKDKEDLNFVWLGGEKPNTDNEDHFFWALKNVDIELRRRIMHVNSCDDVEPYFQAADVFLLTSRSDPFPCVMHEALAAALPIIYMEKSGGAAELVGNRCGIPCPYEDVEELSRSVIKISTDRKMRLKLGLNGKNLLLSEYGFTDYVNKLLEHSSEIFSANTGSLAQSNTKFPIQEVIPKDQQAEVYFLNSDWGVSGVNTLSEELVIELNARGLNTRVLFTQGNNLSEEEIKKLNPNLPVEFLPIDSYESFPANVHNAVLDYFSHHNPCVLITNYDYTVSEVSSRFPAHVGIIGVVHSDDCEHYQHVNMQGHYWNRIITVSNKIFDRVVSLNPGFRSRMVCINNGVRVDISNPDDVSINRAEKKVFRLVYAGRLEHYQKRVERYVELINALEASSVEYQYDFIGAGSQEESLKSALTCQVSSGNVVFHGRLDRSETLEIMKASDAMVLLSDFEGMPMCLLEAISCGCIPIVRKMDGGIVDCINHGKDGFLCETIDSIVNAIKSLSDRKYAELIREQSLAILQTNGLTMDRMVDEYAAVIRSTLADASTESFARPRWIAGA